MDAVRNWLWPRGAVALSSVVMLLALKRARASVRSTVCWAVALFVNVSSALPTLPPAVSQDVGPWLARLPVVSVF
jgi:hypothetical protein